MKVEEIKPYGESAETKHEQMKQAFDHIASGYDRLNRIMSLGLDVGWRRRALGQSGLEAPEKILDVACGTGDFAIMEARRYPSAHIFGLDLSEGMLERAREKAETTGLGGQISFICGDALHPPFHPASFDGISAAFGVRNFEDIRLGIKVLYNLLRPEGRLIILELSRPVRFPFNKIHALYLSHWIPWIGGRLTGCADEYRYLRDSIERVPQGEEMKAIMRDAGFREVNHTPYLWGTCSCYIGVK